MKLDMASAARVKFGYVTDRMEDVEIEVMVPANLLWSGEGMAELFASCRLAHFGAECDPESDHWDSWHLISAQESTDCFVLFPAEIV